MCSLQLPTGKILLHSSFLLLPALSSLSVAPAALIFAVSKSSSSQKWQRAYPEGKIECSDLSNWVSSQMIGSASAEERIQSYSRKGHEEMGYRTMISTIKKTARFLTVAIPKVAYLLLGPGAHTTVSWLHIRVRTRCFLFLSLWCLCFQGTHAWMLQLGLWSGC